jgi:hypothetical protein
MGTPKAIVCATYLKTTDKIVGFAKLAKWNKK